MTISNTPPPAALAASKAGVTAVERRIEIYEADGTTLWTPNNRSEVPRLIGGSVSIDTTRSERRMLDSLELDNRDGALEPSSSGFWYDKVLKPYRGVRYPIIPTAPHFESEAIWEVQLGEFLIDNISDNSDDPIIRVGARDYTKKCMQSKFERSASFAAGTNLFTFIRALAANCGIRKFKINASTETLPNRIDLERGTDRWTVMKDAATSFSYDLFFDNEGYLVMSKFEDPTTGAPQFRLAGGPGGNLVNYQKSADDSGLYNHVVVASDGENVDGGVMVAPYFGEAVNENPSSPSSIQRVGRRTYTFVANYFTSDAQCRELADNLLRVMSLETYSINFTSLNFPWSDAGKVLEVIEPSRTAAESRRFLIDTLNIPLGLEPMSGTGKRLLIVR